MEQEDLLFVVSFTFGPFCGLLFAGHGIEERTAHVNKGISATISCTLELRLTFTRFKHFLRRYSIVLLMFQIHPLSQTYHIE